MSRIPRILLAVKSASVYIYWQGEAGGPQSLAEPRKHGKSTGDFLPCLHPEKRASEILVERLKKKKISLVVMTGLLHDQVK